MPTAQQRPRGKGKGKGTLDRTPPGFIVINMKHYSDDGKTAFTIGEIKQMLADASQELTADQILQHKADITVLLLGTYGDEEQRFIHWADSFLQMKKQGVKFVLANYYWHKTKRRTAAKYNFNNNLGIYELISKLPNISIQAHIKPGLISTALEFRALLRNTACQRPLDELFAGTDFLQPRFIDNKGNAHKAPQGLNLGYLLDCLHIRQELEFAELPPLQKLGRFLKERGFPPQRRKIPKGYHDDKLSTNQELPKHSYYYTKHAANDNLTREMLKKMTLKDLVPYTTDFRTELVKFPMRNDVYIDLTCQANVFEIISSRMFMRLRMELTKLPLIAGSQPKHVYLCAFLICIFQGFVDLRGSQAIQSIVAATSTTLEKILGSKVQPKDEMIHRLPCCTNDSHFMELSPYSKKGHSRRLILRAYNKTGESDGECCYKHMMKTYLPEIPVVEN